MNHSELDWHPEQASVASRFVEILVGSAASIFLFALVAWTISTGEEKPEKDQERDNLRFAPLPPPPPQREIQDSLPSLPNLPTYQKPIDISSASVQFQLQPLEVDFDPSQNIDTLAKMEVDFSQLKTTQQKLDDMVVYHRRELDRGLRAMHQPMPRVSKKTKKDHSVRLLFVVGKDGRVTDEVYILESSDPDLNPDIIAGVKTWTFSPPKRDGKKVRARATVRINISPNNSNPWGN